MKKILPDNVEVEMDRLIEATVEQDRETLFSRAHPELKKMLTDENVNELFAYVKGDEILSKSLANARTAFDASLGGSAKTTYEAVYEVQTNEEFLLLSYRLLKTDTCCQLMFVNVNNSDKSLIDQYAFASAKKGVLHYIVLFGAVLIPVFIVVTLIKCIRTKPLKGKWLWIIFILIGIHGVIFNWATGEISTTFFSKWQLPNGEYGYKFSPIQFNVLGAGFTQAGLLSPWMFQVYFPLGAVMFWILHGRKSRNQA